MKRWNIWNNQGEIVAKALKTKKCSECLCKTAKKPEQAFCARFWEIYTTLAYELEGLLI